MSFETFPCGSPCVSPEEPAPSLYVENPDEDPSRLLIKKPMESEPSRLAETANIEDKIMNEDEIAQVNASGGEGLKINTLSEDGRTRKNGDDSARRVEGRHVYDKVDIARPHWIHLNYGNPATSPAHSSLLKEQQLKESLPSGQNFESGDRASVIIKRSKEQGEIDSDSDNESQDTSKVNTNDSLRCNENISGIEASEENVASLHGHSRAIYYNYDVNHEELRKLQDKGNAKLVRGIHGEAKAVPIYYMPAGYSHMVAMPGGASAGNANMLQRDHFAQANSNEVKRLHLQQHLDYVAGRPEQQVPVASNVNTSERYGSLQHGSAAPGIQYVDRRLMHGGYAMVPGIGPVFYQGIPVGGDQSHYENFTSLQQQFVPMSNIPAETTSSQPQAQPTTSSGANNDHAHQRSQEKLLSKRQVCLW